MGKRGLRVVVVVVVTGTQAFETVMAERKRTTAEIITSETEKCVVRKCGLMLLNVKQLGSIENENVLDPPDGAETAGAG